MSVNSYATDYNVKIGDFYYDLVDDYGTDHGYARLVHEPDFKNISYGYVNGEIVIPSSFIYDNVTYTVTEIGPKAFYNSENIKSVLIPNTITHIYERAFAGCLNLNNITIGEGVLRIERHCFLDCKNLKIINFNAINCDCCYSGINYNCFNGTSVEEIIIGDNVETVFENTFCNFKNIMTVVIENTNTNITEQAFQNCNRPNTVVINKFGKDTNELGIYNWLKTSSIENILIGDSVTSIPNKYFKGLTDLKNVSIGASVNFIGEMAFYGCENLKQISLPANLKSIGKYAFGECSFLENIKIPNTLSNLGAGAFYGCRRLTKIEIPESITSIEDRLFYKCLNLLDVTLPNTITTIGYDAFSFCQNLSDIIIPNSVITIGPMAFSDCIKLSKITIPNSVSWIREYAFYECRNVTMIIIPKSVKKIGGGAFRGISKDAKLIIEDISKWGEIEFEQEMQEGAYYAKYYSNPIATTNCFYTLRSEKPVEHLVINNETEVITINAFNDSRNLKTAYLRVNKIGDKSFANCRNLTDLCLDVNELSGYTFDNILSLRNIFALSDIPPIATNWTFSKDNYSSTTLCVPIGCKIAYEQATCWKNFSKIIESNFEYIDEIFAADYDYKDASVDLPIADDSDCNISIGHGCIDINTSETSFIQIYDIYGRQIHIGYGSVSLNVTSGIYIVKVGNSTQKVFVK